MAAGDTRPVRLDLPVLAAAIHETPPKESVRNPGCGGGDDKADEASDRFPVIVATRADTPTNATAMAWVNLAERLRFRSQQISGTREPEHRVSS